MRLLLDIQTQRLAPRFALARRELEELVGRLLAALGLEHVNLSLTLVDDQAMARLNRQHLSCDGPTNILSFPESDPQQPGELGALFLSVDTLAREAFLYGQEPARHLARLLAHGILHLAGLEHGPDMDARVDLAVDAVQAVRS